MCASKPKHKEKKIVLKQKRNIVHNICNYMIHYARKYVRLARFASCFSDTVFFKNDWNILEPWVDITSATKVGPESLVSVLKNALGECLDPWPLGKTYHGKINQRRGQVDACSPFRSNT